MNNQATTRMQLVFKWMAWICGKSMKKWLLSLGLVFTAVIIVTGCGVKEDTTAASSSIQTDAEASREATVITIEAKNFAFNQKEIKVKKGDNVSITLKNSQGNHAIHIDGYNKDIRNNKTVTFVADQAGQFKFFCSIMCGSGHADMVGTIIVE
ncbi:cytochrome C oxidase subunit II [Paenibacillus albiflavus]|uniref:Cytochrome C oxidase subunit II n=1 Tax=Paenibacillus albiflavus TaxID=2545760 RepID=A0A4R4EF39_9BACL|nr:cupredoxin domain-containing protein [Paenibacillus albiflavus]TCZ78157.1 cytochrome C oxidase subunit II [Paenibacillus albiflavus]